jgi:hypothetical protein
MRQIRQRHNSFLHVELVVQLDSHIIDRETVKLTAMQFA